MSDRNISKMKLLSQIESVNKSIREVIEECYELKDMIDIYEDSDILNDFIPQLNKIISNHMGSSEDFSALSITLSGLEPIDI